MTRMSTPLDETVKRLGIKKLDLAEAVGVRPETVSRWLAGKNDPWGAHAGRVLSFLNRPENLRKLGRRKPLSFEDVFGSKEAA